MLPKNYEDLPGYMRNDIVKAYYDVLNHKRGALFIKRLFDIIVSLVLILFLSPVMIIIAFAIKVTSPGPIFYRQRRVTIGGKEFFIYKFRSMVDKADQQGPLVTVGNDSRITNVGRFIRKTHLDEIPQVFNVLKGDMSFVGTRPEVPKYVDYYTDEMKASLLLPAGITSEASIVYKDEAELIKKSADADETYINVILPEKMRINLSYLNSFSIWKDISILFRTALLIFKR